MTMPRSGFTGFPRFDGALKAWLAALLLIAAVAHAESQVLYEKQSLFGLVIVTQEPDGLRTLRFERGGARQSVANPDDPSYLALPYARVALIGLALCREPQRMLVVGLGGGSLPRFLRKHYPDAAIDAVDIDPEVVHVSRQYFGFKDDARMRAHVADGRGFIERTTEPYDIIFLDAFGTSNVPAHMTTQEFLSAVRRAVRPDGVVVGNIWGRDHNALYDAMVRTYEHVFDEVTVVPVGASGNRIVLALPRKEDVTSRTLARRASAVSSSKGFPFDLGTGARNAPEHDREQIRSARVLSDKREAGAAQ